MCLYVFVMVVDEVLDYCYAVKKEAEREGIRVEIDTSGDECVCMYYL